MGKFKVGDRVIFIRKDITYNGYKYLDKGIVINTEDSDNIIVKFDNGYNNRGQFEKNFELESIYDTPLYKIMRETDDE